MNYDEIKAQILAVLNGQKRVTVKLAALDAKFADEVVKAVPRVKLSSRDRIFVSVQGTEIQFTNAMA